jgi:hypothetical protein
MPRGASEGLEVVENPVILKPNPHAPLRRDRALGFGRLLCARTLDSASVTSLVPILYHRSALDENLSVPD